MDIGIVSIAYNDYGKFLPQWARSIAKLDTPPAQTTVVLGKGHGLTDKHRKKALAYLPDLQIVEAKVKVPRMGTLRNVAVKHTDTEWIQYLSVDDIVLPWAVDEYQRYEEGADYIVIRWKSRATWDADAPEYEHTPRTPYEMAKGFEGRGFINNQSPYRRWLWESRPYQPHDYPNAPFVADCVEQGARFAKTERPCTMYLRRLDSHCGRFLGRRQLDGSKRVVPSEKKQARFWKNDMRRRIAAYYQEM